MRGGLIAYDNLCKLLAEKYPEAFTAWLLGEIPGEVEILKTELSIEPLRADAVIFYRTSDRIAHIEFQTVWPIEPPMPLRMLDYWVRLYRLNRVPIHQVVVVLIPPPEGRIIETSFRVGTTYHEFTVIKVHRDQNVGAGFSGFPQ